MANPILAKKSKQAIIERRAYIRDRYVEETAPKPPLKPRKRMDPRERSWAHAYLKHVARVKGLPYAGARESMQDLGAYFGITVPVDKSGASRSPVAISLAKAILAQTGIMLPAHQ